MANHSRSNVETIALSDLQDSTSENVDATREPKDELDGNRFALAQAMSSEELLSEGKKIRWKADKRLLAMAWIMFVFNYFDRVSETSRCGGNRRLMSTTM